jgi:hypothetical protein
MSPKEKAEELTNQFMELKHVKLSDYSRIEWPTARKCALIVVDEILKANPTSEVSAPFLGTRIYDNKSYWEQVKQEIENL